MQREYEVHGRRLQIHLGDITRLDVDAIVSSENSDLLMDRPDGPSVSAAIRRVEGEAVARDLARLGPLEPGRAVVLPSRHLPCRWVIHAASVIRTEEGHRSSPEVIRGAVRSALGLAAGLGLGSLAFPAFGVRAADVPRRQASQAMVQEIVAALRESTPLERVVVALLDPESFLTFFEEAMVGATRANEPLQLGVGLHEGRVTWSVVDAGPVERLSSSSAEPAGLEERLRRLQGAADRRLLDARSELEALGREVGALIPGDVAERLAPGGDTRPVVLRLDERLAGIPFELAWDGERFLLERAQVARLLRARGEPGAPPRDPPERTGLEAVVVGAGGAGLPAAAREADGVADLIWRRAGDRARLQVLGGERATPGAVLDAIGRADLLHWCGHTRSAADDPAWELAGGAPLRPDDLGAAPASLRLAVANSCGGQGAAFARAFLLGGARNFVGTWWDVDDALARSFALHLYEELVLGRPLGDALASARAELRRHDPLHWAAYVHYGDPRERLFQPAPLR